MSRSVLPFLFALLVSACGEYRPRIERGDTLALDPSFSPAVTARLVQGCTEWNLALPSLQIVCKTSEIGDWFINKKSMECCLGHTHYSTPIIEIDSDQITALTGHVGYNKHTMMHEIGHGLGFHDHLDSSEALMGPNNLDVFCVDQESLDAVLDERPDLKENARPACD